MLGHSSPPVLIAGAGPAGLAAALTLSQLGIETVLVERRPELSSLPRATAVSTRSMELLRSWGLEAAVRSRSLDVDWLGWTAHTLATAADGEAWPTGLPTREQAAAISPTAPACIPQDHLEPLMLDHLRSSGTTEVLLGTEVTGVEQRPDGVRVRLRDRAGAVRHVEAAYVIGADGAHSRVRTALGIAMRGPDGLERAVTAVFRAPLWALLGEHRHAIYSVEHPEGAGTYLPAGRGDRWLFGAYARPEEGVDPASLARRIRAGSGVPDLPVAIERTGAFTFAAQLADRFRAGRVFLAGDAAHRVTPRGGTGMNTAIRSGHDLGWKLGWVLRGWAGPDLLDSYEDERRPIAEHNAARSADPEGTTKGAGDALQVDLGRRIPHVWVAPGVSTLDLLGPGLTRFTGPVAKPAPELDVPVAVRPLDPVAARAVGVPHGGVLLVRPDGVPAEAPALAVAA